MGNGRAVIRTLPLENANYGGILQAFALQKIVRRWFADVRTDVSTTGGWDRQLKYQLLRLKKLAISKPLLAPEVRSAQYKQIYGFVSEHIDTCRIFNLRGGIDQNWSENVDALIVGSDQVWRPAYGDVRSYLLEGIPVSEETTKIAYAASFGVESLTSEQAANFRQMWPAARRFQGISVRELSAVPLVNEFWGIDAKFVLDPTFLLGKDEWLKLTNANPCADRGKEPVVFAYLLDPTEFEVAEMQRFARGRGASLRLITPNEPLSTAGRLRGQRIVPEPSVSDWLSGFRDADIVLTDSYHGLVFSLIFQVPVLVLENTGRGRERFASLLGVAELGDRMIKRESLRAGLMDMGNLTDTDWGMVERRLAPHRENSVAFLEEHLMPISGGR